MAVVSANTEVTTVVQPEPEGQVRYPEVSFTRSDAKSTGLLAMQPHGDHDRYSTNLSREDARELAYALLDFADGAPVVHRDRHQAFKGE